MRNVRSVVLNVRSAMLNVHSTLLNVHSTLLNENFSYAKILNLLLSYCYLVAIKNNLVQNVDEIYSSF